MKDSSSRTNRTHHDTIPTLIPVSLLVYVWPFVSQYEMKTFLCVTSSSAWSVYCMAVLNCSDVARGGGTAIFSAFVVANFSEWQPLRLAV